MKSNRTKRGLTIAGAILLAATLQAQPGPDGPPFGPGGPGPMNRQKAELLRRFDNDKDGKLNATERKAAREFLARERAEGRGRRGFGPPGGFGQPEAGTAKPGKRVSPADVKNYPDAPLYDLQTVRTYFLEFEDADWEKELADFHDTDVEVPAKLTVDGKTYSDVGVHFRGMSSYGMVREGQKRSLNISVDFVHDKQNIAGYRTLNLLNSHEDPSFLRSVLFYRIAREYVPAPKANFARVVINGENWGIYSNVEQFNKDFEKEWFGTTKGARWKVPGSPGGRGSLAYIGDDVEAYKKIYEIKSKDEAKSWSALVRLCRVLNETPADKLEAAIAPILDVDGALKFLALDNALINNDGYWIRTSDYSIYLDEKGRFHILPQDANETFARPGGPGFGGPGGGPGMMLPAQMLSQGDRNSDQKLSPEEFSALAGSWYDKLDPEKKGKIDREEFLSHAGEILPPPPFGPRGGFGPARFIGPGLFAALDANKDESLTRSEMTATFTKWFSDWDTNRSQTLDEEKLRKGITSVLPAPNFGPGGPGGGPGGRRGGGPGGNMPRVEGVKLDPLQMANDPNKPLISKLLAVPAYRERYLGYVRDIAEKWLDWKTLGPMSEQFHTLIADEVRADTRKLDSTEDFEKSLTQDTRGSGFGPGGGGAMGLKNFADQRRTFLLEHPEIKKLGR